MEFLISGAEGIKEWRTQGMGRGKRGEQRGEQRGEAGGKMERRGGRQRGEMRMGGSGQDRGHRWRGVEMEFLVRPLYVKGTSPYSEGRSSRSSS